LQREVEAALAGVALAARAPPELVVDAAALVALGAEHVQPAQLLDPLALLAALGVELGEQLAVAALTLSAVWRAVARRIELEPLGQHLLAGQALGVAAQDDVDAPAGHVGGDGDRVQTAGLDDDTGLLLVLLGVQHGMRDAALVEHAREALGLLDRHRADEHGLPALVRSEERRVGT